MLFEEAKKYFMEQFKLHCFEVLDEHGKEIFYKIPHSDLKIKITEEEISQYAECHPQLSDYSTKPFENSIISKNYTEQVVTYNDIMRRRIFLPRDRTYCFGEKTGASIYAEISPASDIYMNYFRFNENYIQLIMLEGQKPLRRHDFVEIKDIISKPLTIKVYFLNASSIDNAKIVAEQIIDTCFFELAYLKNISLSVVEEWPRRHPREKPFQFGDRHMGLNFALSKALYNSDIIKFYQRGLIAEDPFAQFISFYQVIEYFFISVADEQLYATLARRLNDPKFTTNPKNLNRIIQDTLDHRTETDETEMLKLVLNKYVLENEVIEYIKSYEEYLSDNIFTKKRKVFGEELEIKINPGHILGNVAKRIKIIRNALVHSSDRYNREERYVPSKSAEIQLKKEIPLLKFLAERIIISTAK